MSDAEGIGRLESRLQDLVEGRATAEELEELKALLAGDEAARQLYLEVVQIHGMLGQRDHRGFGSFAEVVPMDRIVARQRRRSMRIAGLSAAAAVVVAAVVLMYTILPSPPAARFAVSPQADFILTHVPAEDGSEPEGNVLQPGSRLQVTRGTVELSFGSGVRGIVRAPADLTLRAEDLVALRYGTTWYDVPQKAVGFQVDTPDFLLTDLGTQFGIVSRPGTMDEVHVFKGEVEVRHHAGLGQTISVAAGNARLAGGDGGWQEIAQVPSLFLTVLADEEPVPHYLHWAFDGFEGDTLPVGGTHPAASTITSTRGYPDEGPQPVDGVLGGALAFDAAGDHIKTDWPGIGGSKARSVAFWLRLPPAAGTSGENATLITWGDPSADNPNRGWAVQAAREPGTFPKDMRAELRGRTLLQLWTGAGWLTGTTDLADGEWHHVAFCYTGEDDAEGRPLVLAYIDGFYEKTHRHHSPAVGRAYAEAPAIDTDISGAFSNPLLIGRSKTRLRDSCNAAIDELYIFDGHLSQDLVYALARAAEGWRP